MTTKKTADETIAPSTTSAPIKRLELRREKVRNLRVRTGVQTGGESQLTGPSDPAPSFGSNVVSLSGLPSGSMYSRSLVQD
jgi:hypothetical protein